MKTLYSIQTYRGFAALIVVLLHTHLTLDFFSSSTERTSFFMLGHAGVEFFFVLSGFILTHVYFGQTDTKSRPDITHFLINRGIRIYPIYWLVTFTFLPLWLFRPSFGLQYHKEFSSLIFSLLLLPQTHEPHITVAWSLTHEIMFYIFFSVIILNHKAGRLLTGLWMTSIIALNLIYKNFDFPLSFILSKYNLLFGFGIFTALLARYQKPAINKYGVLIFIAGNILFVATGIHENYFYKGSDYIWLFGLTSSMIIAGCNSEAVNSFFSTKKLLIFLGEASYSIYLLHCFVIEFLCKRMKNTNLLGIIPNDLTFWLLALSGVLGGSFLYIIFEKRILVWMKTRYMPDMKIKKEDAFSPGFATGNCDETI